MGSEMCIRDRGDAADHYWPRLRDLCRLTAERDMVLGITVFFGWPKHRADWEYHPLNVTNGGPVRDDGNPITQAQVIASPGTEVLDEDWDDAWPTAKQTQWIWERFADKLIRETAPYGNVFLVFMDEHSYSEGNCGDHFAAFFRQRGALWCDWDHRRDAVDLCGRFAKGVAERVGIPPKLLGPDVRQRPHHLRRRRIRILIGVELDHVRCPGLKTRRIARDPLHVVAKVTHHPASALLCHVTRPFTGSSVAPDETPARRSAEARFPLPAQTPGKASRRHAGLVAWVLGFGYNKPAGQMCRPGAGAIHIWKGRTMQVISKNISKYWAASAAKASRKFCNMRMHKLAAMSSTTST